MKKFLVAVSGVALMGLVAGSAHAQCSFNSPGKAKGIKSSFIRAFAGCGNSGTFPTSNDVTKPPSLTASCSTPAIQSLYKFDTAKGKCDFKSSNKVTAPCINGAGSCGELFISVKCGGVLDASNAPITPAAGIWTIGTTTRATFNDSVGGDMTVIDFPLPIVIGPGDKGKLSVKTTATQALEAALGPGTELPDCVQVEIIKVSILDPTGGVFAVLGGGSK